MFEKQFNPKLNIQCFLFLICVFSLCSAQSSSISFSNITLTRPNFVNSHEVIFPVALFGLEDSIYMGVSASGATGSNYYQNYLYEFDTNLQFIAVYNLTEENTNYPLANYFAVPQNNQIYITNSYSTVYQVC